MKILERLGEPQSNLEILATHVRQGELRPSYVFRDELRLSDVIEKWQFQPKSDTLSRCGYDYQIVAINGETKITLSICFACNTLVLGGKEKFAIRKRHIEKLFAADFQINS